MEKLSYEEKQVDCKYKNICKFYNNCKSKQITCWRYNNLEGIIKKNIKFDKIYQKK